MAVLEHLFSIIEKNDPETMSILWAWITGGPLKKEVAACA
jgi:hypothetical protein